MKFDFDKVNDRRNTGSMKWDVAANELPMWVADMDFQTAPAVIEAMKKRVELGVFGYHIVPDEWYHAIQGWWGRRHNFEIEKEWLIFCTGVVPAITCAVKRMTNVGDNVLIQTPVYDIFFHSVENQGRNVVENPLVYDGNTYQIDYRDLEEKLADPLTTLMVLCNPHNPVGKIWTKEELVRIGELCKKYHVTVLADEIHCDLTEPGHNYTPYASASRECLENSIICVSATKAFNIAGLQTAAVIAASDEIRAKMNRGLNSDEVAEPNCFAVDAVVAAFTEGEEWLEELRAYISGNRKTVAEYIVSEIPEIHMVDADSTYLLWMDCSAITDDTEILCDFIRRETGLYLTAGGQYRGNGAAFIRMNVACPRAQVLRGLKMLKAGVQQFMKAGQ